MGYRENKKIREVEQARQSAKKDRLATISSVSVSIIGFFAFLGVAIQVKMQKLTHQSLKIENLEPRSDNKVPNLQLETEITEDVNIKKLWANILMEYIELKKADVIKLRNEAESNLSTFPNSSNPLNERYKYIFKNCATLLVVLDALKSAAYNGYEDVFDKVNRIDVAKQFDAWLEAELSRIETHSHLPKKTQDQLDFNSGSPIKTELLILGGATVYVMIEEGRDGYNILDVKTISNAKAPNKEQSIKR